MPKILSRLRKELALHANEQVRKSTENFFKHEIKTYGLPSAKVKAIAKTFWKEIKKQPKNEIFNLCEQLWQSGLLEEGGVACEWSFALRNAFEPEDFTVFEGWLADYVYNWASCDVLCNHTVGSILEKYPRLAAQLPAWANSLHRWLKRGAAVSLIVPARKGMFADEAFEIAGVLLTDQDDMVQKGYGWLLKVLAGSSPENQARVFAFVMQNKSAMPRTALRYAIEKMPTELKKQAMQ